MIKAIIIDDEQHCTDRLKRLLEEDHASDIQLAGTYSSVATGLAGIRDQQPALLFLDVQINDKTGFDLLREFGKADFEVIFTTAHDRFAVQAFKFSALDYLLKPVDKDELHVAVQKLKDKTPKKEIPDRLDVLLHNMRPGNSISKRIIVPTGNGLEILEVGEIVRCQSDINYTTIYLKDKQKLVVAKTLKDFEEMLTDHGFFRLHNSHLINLNYIRSYNKGKGGSVILTDGLEIEVSSRRKEDFLKKLSEL